MPRSGDMSTGRYLFRKQQFCITLVHFQHYIVLHWSLHQKTTCKATTTKQLRDFYDTWKKQNTLAIFVISLFEHPFQRFLKNSNIRAVQLNKIPPSLHLLAIWNIFSVNRSCPSVLSIIKMVLGALAMKSVSRSTHWIKISIAISRRSSSSPNITRAIGTCRCEPGDRTQVADWRVYPTYLCTKRKPCVRKTFTPSSTEGWKKCTLGSLQYQSSQSRGWNSNRL